MLDQLTVERFAALLHQTFRVRLDDLALDLELVEAQGLKSHGRSAGNRQPFSILFRGPLRPILPQRVYPLDHPALGVLEIFLVPVGPDDIGQRYEAIFN